MTKLGFVASPYLLGFEQIERLAERAAKGAGDGYPPFNIEAASDDTYRITLAVAGFCADDLEITLEDRQLVIEGRRSEPEGAQVFLHRGIAARAFRRNFVLADGVEVIGAGIENGLLNIDLKRATTLPQVTRIVIAHKDGG